MAEAVGLDLQDKYAHISSLNKTPASIVEEYAAKKRLVPKYNLIHNGVLYRKVSFKYSLTLDNYVAVGEGSSKKEAKHMAALNILKMMIKDKPQLLKTNFKKWDFDNHVVSPYDNNIKVNAIGQLNDICTINNLRFPEFHFVKEEGQAHAKLFTMSCHVAKMIETATHKTKRQAKHLAACQMINRLMTIDKSLIKKDLDESDSMRVLKKVEIIKTGQIAMSAPIDEDISNYHLLFKKANWLPSDTLNKVCNQYNKNNELDLLEPFEVLSKVVTESGMDLVTKTLNPEPVSKNGNRCYIFAIENVYPSIYGIGMGEDIDIAKENAALKLLTNICILLK